MIFENYFYLFIHFKLCVNSNDLKKLFLIRMSAAKCEPSLAQSQLVYSFLLADPIHVSCSEQTNKLFNFKISYNTPEVKNSALNFACGLHLCLSNSNKPDEKNKCGICNQSRRSLYFSRYRPDSYLFLVAEQLFKGRRRN